MPLYEYECEECGFKFEQLQKMTDEALVECPKCAKKSLRKLISATGFQLKGNGWYATDFKTPKEAPQCPATGKLCDKCNI